MLALLGFIVALAMFFHVRRHLVGARRARRVASPPLPPAPPCAGHDWQNAWAEKVQRRLEREQRRWEALNRQKDDLHRDFERKLDRERRRWDGLADKFQRKYGVHIPVAPMQVAAAAAATAMDAVSDNQTARAARRRARAEVGFYTHLMSYLGVIALLALINLMTTRYPWFMWPALGWGIGLFAHYMAVFGRQLLRERYFEPAVEREVRREKVALQTEKQASIDELSSTIAHEIRNPIAAAKSLVQQMGEDPTSVENVEYAKVAIDELDRVERRISHLLRFAKEEDYAFDAANLAGVVDAALTQLRAKLDAAKVRVARNYIAGPTVRADGEKLKQVFVNVLDNAIDALDGVSEDRRIDLFIENGGRRAVVRLRDNGCGIAPDKIERIFNPFFTTKEKGTGLGMAISKKIVEAHEGTIDVVSEPGKGAEFAVALPLPQ